MGDDYIIDKSVPSQQKWTQKASKNEMNRSISLIYENRPHLFHGLLDNEPLPAMMYRRKNEVAQGQFAQAQDLLIVKQLLRHKR